LMGIFANNWAMTIVAWTLFCAITAANLWLVLQVLGIV
jgi:manganese transport protein